MLIKQKILLTTLALFIVPVLAIGVISYFLAENFLLQSRRDSLQVVAQLKANKIEDFIRQKNCSYYEIRKAEDVLAHLEKYRAAVASGDQEKLQLLQELFDRDMVPFQEISGVDGIFLTDARGEIFYQSNSYHREHGLHGDLPLHGIDLQQIIDSRLGKVVFVESEHEQGEDSFFFIGPIFSKQSQFLALMVFEVGMTTIYTEIDDTTGLGETGKTTLGRRVNGDHFVHLTPIVRGRKKTERTAIEFCDSEALMPMQEAVLGRSGTGIWKNCEGVDIIASWTYLPKLDLGLVAKIDLKEAFASIDVFKKFTISLILGIAGLGMLIGMKIAESAAAPIQQLHEGAERIGQGDFSYRLPVVRKDEFGRLAQAFNDMTENLLRVTASRDQLNREITERIETAKKLSEREKQLRDLFDNANDLIHSATVDGDILFVNRAWRETLGYNTSEVAEMNIFDVIHPDFHESCATFFGNSSPSSSSSAIETAFVTRDGQRIELEGNVSFQFKDGRPIASRGIFRDITDRKQAEKAVEEERRFLQSVIDGVEDPLYVIGNDYRVLLMNQVAQEKLHEDACLSRSLTCHQASHNCEHPCSGVEHPCPLQKVKETGRSVTVVHTHLMKDGEERILELAASPLKGPDGRMRGIIESSRDITEKRKAEIALHENEKRLNFLAHHDPLTRLANRVLFNERLAQALAKAKRNGQQVALLFLDLDRFKNINDSLGHAFGDQVLKTVAERLDRQVRSTDTVARLGGDEFLIIAENVADSQDAANLAQKVLDLFSHPVEIQTQELAVTASVGVSMYPSDGRDSEELLKCSDVAMYGSKKSGGNSFQFYSPEMNAHTHELLMLERDIMRAVKEDQFAMYYQPQLDLQSGRLVGIEALVRWQHPEKGLLNPLDFIPLAEETGLIIALGKWILQASCQQLREWRDAGYDTGRICVNISGRQFRQGTLIGLVEEVLERTGLNPAELELELTESVIMEDVEETFTTFAALQERGINLAIDDFGTGYSSLNYLKRFPISKFKIDRSFIQDITTDANDAAIAGTVIALAKSLNVAVIAEGIETEEQLRLLEEMGCRQGQGYLFSEPLSAVEMERFLLGGATCQHLLDRVRQQG